MKERDIPIEIWVTDESGNQDYCRTYFLLQDNHESCPEIDDLTHTISGNVLNPKDLPLNEVYFTIVDENDIFESVKNQADGSFQVELPEEKTYQLSGHRNSHPMDGISTLDLIFIQKHILGIQPLENLWLRIAADVNNDYQINVVDLQLIRDHILGNLNPTQQFPQWKIIGEPYITGGSEVPKYQTKLKIPALNGDIKDLVFRAVKMGDVNASHFTPSSQRTIENHSQISVPIVDQNFKKGEIVKIIFKTEEVKHILGLQAKFTFDPAALEFYHYESPSLPLQDHHFGFGELEDGSIYLSWNEAEGLEVYPEKGWLELEFIAITDGTLSNYFYPGAGDFSNEFYLPKESYSMDFSYQNLKTNKELITTAKPYPNPFSNQTLIPFKVSTETTIELEITDVSGRKIFSTSKPYRAGSHQITIDRSMVPQSGVYLYALKTKNTVSSGRLVVMD